MICVFCRGIVVLVGVLVLVQVVLVCVWIFNFDDVLLFDVCMGFYCVGDGVCGYVIFEGVCVDFVDMFIVFDILICFDKQLCCVIGWVFDECCIVMIDCVSGVE